MYDALWSCITDKACAGICTPGIRTKVECVFNLDGSGPCDVCLQANCCNDLSVCEHETKCASCINWLGTNEQLCVANAKYVAARGCIDTHCTAECSPYLAGMVEDSDVQTMRGLLMPVWEKHKVDLVLNGHDHEYERSKPVRGAWGALQVQPDALQGTTYVVCAGAGAAGYEPGATPADWREVAVGFINGPYSGVYGMLELEGRRLSWKAWGLNPNSTQGSGDTVIDQFSIQK